MLKLSNLLLYEYFPLELPPCFGTASMEPHFKKMKGWCSCVNIKSSKPLSFSGYKSENSRRKFCVPNFYHYYKAAECINKYKSEILNITSKSQASLTAPLKDTTPDNRAYTKRSYNVNTTKTEVEKIYKNNTYEIRLDISSCFESIYTHSIAWAMHGKEVAQNPKRKLDLPGDFIDKEIRAMNRSQTNGILVGNALSRIVSEIILCTVDIEIQNNFPKIMYKRYVDDYFIYLDDVTKIQSVVSFIRNELGKFELNLNENKIQINESPFLFGNMWVEELKLFAHMNSEAILNKAIALYTQYKDIRILKYALKVVTFNDYNDENWDVIESKLLSLWAKFPSLAGPILNLFLEEKDKVNSHYLEECIYSVLEKSMPLKHHQEVIWAIWFARVFNIKLEEEYILKVFKSDNDLAIIILLDMLKAGICTKTKSILAHINDIRKTLQDLDSPEDADLMQTSHWLLAYEADRNNWLNSSKNTYTIPRNHDFYKKLIANNVFFYNTGFEYSLAVNNKDSQYLRKSEFQEYIRRINTMIESLSSDVVDTKEYLNDLSKIQNEVLELLDDSNDYY